MDFVYVRSRREILFVPLLVLALTGCFKNPGSPSLPTFTTSIPVSPVYDYTAPIYSYLHALGSCQGNTDIVFTYSSSLTPSTTVDGVCKNNQVDLKLSVQSGNLSQVFTVVMVAKLRSSSSPPKTVTVNFNPPTNLVPGYAINSGGGISTSAAAQINQTFGEVLSPASGTEATYTAPGLELRMGVQGVNDP